MKPKVFTLKNNLSVIFVDAKAFPTLTTLLLVGAGSRYENEVNNGIAHFFEHMAFKGSKKYPTSFFISSTIEGLGGVFNAFTSKDHTGYWIKATNNNFDTVVDVLSDMVLSPKLLEEEIDREKGVIIQEINLYEDTPYNKVGDLFENLLYKSSPLGYDVIGSKKTVKNFTRETFVDYMARLYHPSNAVLIVAGGLNRNDNEYLKIIEEKFGNWNGEKEKSDFISVKENQTAPQLKIKHKKTEQAHFCLGFRTFSFQNPDKYVLSVLAAMLGGGMSSRLFIEVRERRGLCYYISTRREFYHDTGNFVTQAGVANDLEKLKIAVQTILKEHRKIANGNITQEEIKKAKQLLKGRLLLSMEDSFNIAAFFGIKKILENNLETPQERIQALEKVKTEDVINLAKKIFVPQGLNFSLIGPFEEKDLDLQDILFV